mmetsp:Transcript_24659/g.30327  ORF Transcript_24659/g.30327 Transcript_24659/m.30327 type:complete len:159 (+) Transcript_24659:181-657(+)
MSSKSNNIGKVIINNHQNITRSNKPRSRINHNKKARMTEKIPSLQEFMHRQKVVNQYRSFMKVISNKIDDDTYNIQMKKEVRGGFKRLVDEKDDMVIAMALKEGNKKLKELKLMVGYVDPSRKNSNSKDNEDPDSWISIDDKEDPRGRVGINWPWDNK